MKISNWVHRPQRCFIWLALLLLVLSMALHGVINPEVGGLLTAAAISAFVTGILGYIIVGFGPSEGEGL